MGSKSVFHLLDDQVSVPRATDINFLHKLNERLKKEKFYTAPKTLSGGTFTISHYAGKVLILSNEDHYLIYFYSLDSVFSKWFLRQEYGYTSIRSEEVSRGQ